MKYYFITFYIVHVSIKIDADGQGTHPSLHILITKHEIFTYINALIGTV